MNDTLLLNAGVVPGNEVRRTSDGFEESFAASIVGHHILANRLIEAGLVPDGARIVIAGSEAANGDLPKMMDAELYDFATGEGTDFGPDLHSAMVNYARAQDPSLFSPMRYYAVAKTFVAWSAASMHRRYGERIQVFTVSPGASMSTNAARHQTGFKKFLFTKAMPLLGGILGMDQPMDVAAKRYVDVLLARGDFESGRTYTSAPKKMVGPIQAMKHPHLLDERRQETAWT